eukprot:jgi/Mesvir1/18314/Mv18467-RA.1
MPLPRFAVPLAVAGALVGGAAAVRAALSDRDDVKESEPPQVAITYEEPFTSAEMESIPPPMKADEVLASLNTPEKIDADVKAAERAMEVERALLETTPTPMPLPTRLTIASAPGTSSPISDRFEVDEPVNALSVSEIIRRLGNHAGNWYALGPLVVVVDSEDLKFYVAKPLSREQAPADESTTPVFQTNCWSVPTRTYTKKEIDALFSNLRRQASPGSRSGQYVVLSECGPYRIGVALFENEDPFLVDGVKRGSKTIRKLFAFRYTDYYDIEEMDQV